MADPIRAPDEDNNDTPIREPNLTSPPIYIQDLKCFLDCGTYVMYVDGERQRYGQLISTTDATNVEINHFETFATVVEDNNLSEPTLQNPYVDVIELVQTSVIHKVPSHEITGIIFLFSKDDIVYGNFPCEGIELAFVIRFQFFNNRLHIIPKEKYLPFPCSYPSYLLCTSYAKRIFHSLLEIKAKVTQVMCRKGREASGRNFITGSATIRMEKESWIFIVSFFARRGISVHGPFQSKSRELQMRNGLELNSVRKSGEVYMLQFATRSQFQVYDQLFGKYSRIGFVEPNPRVGRTVDAQNDHQLFLMGSGLFPSQYEFKRRNTTFYGVDFKFNQYLTTLSISLRYKKEYARDNPVMRNYIQERLERRQQQGQDQSQNNTYRSSYEHCNHEYSTTIKTNAIFNLGICTFQVLDGFEQSKTSSVCVVTSSVNDNLIDTRKSFSYDIIHRQICLFLQSMFN